MAGKELKQLYLNIGKKHIFIFFIGVIIISLLMNIFPSFFGIETIDWFRCSNGTLEQVIINQTTYCGEHISSWGYTLVDGVPK